MSRITHLVSAEEGEDVWMAGGENGLITLYVTAGVPSVIVAHSPREVPGWDWKPSCRRLEGLPCWSLYGLAGMPLMLILAELKPDDDLWAVLDRAYEMYLARQ